MRHTKIFGLHYGKETSVLEGYSDANWISDSKSSKFTSGYVFTLGGAAISWNSTKQTVLARSTMESEFIALDKATKEAEWLRNVLDIFLCGRNMFQLYAYIVIVNKLYLGLKIISTMVNLVTSEDDIKPLDNLSQMV